MKIENPAALRFIIDNDLYLLQSDKTAPQPTVDQPIVQPVIIEPAAQTPVIDFKYKGGNKKRFLILVSYTTAEFIEDAHLAALENILKRKELSLDDVAIANIPNMLNGNKKDILEFFKPQRLLIMGKEAIPTDFPAPALNQAAEVENIKTLYSFSFAEMMDSNDNKKIFWDQMKTL